MPLERLALILIVVIAAAGATIWVGWLLLVTLGISPLAGMAFAVPTALIAYFIVRVIAERLSNKEDDHYDGIEK
jgi:membrane protein implicated in regulation of membrane protease activity